MFVYISRSCCSKAGGEENRPRLPYHTCSFFYDRKGIPIVYGTLAFKFNHEFFCDNLESFLVLHVSKLSAHFPPFFPGQKIDFYGSLYHTSTVIA